MDFGQRLKCLRLEMGYTQKELGDAAGVTAVAVRSWEQNTKKPGMEALLSLGRVLNVSMDTLMGVEIGNTAIFGQILSPAERALVRNYQALDDFGKRAVENLCAIEAERAAADAARVRPEKVVDLDSVRAARYIPHFTSPSAAGVAAPIDAAEYGMMQVSSSVPDAADFAVDIQGDSMEPYIHDGDMVYVRRDAELAVGDIGIFFVDGAMYCKQYYLDGEKNLILVSLNPERRDANVFVSAEGGQSVRICGKVLLGRRVELPGYLFEE